MAKSKTGSVVDPITGRVGNSVFRRHGAIYVIAIRPQRTSREPTAGQLRHRERFRLAARYARAATNDPAIRPLYAVPARERLCAPYAIAIRDFFKSPRVDRIDLSTYAGRAGDTITICASDDFEVVAVDVVITGAEGVQVERGPAQVVDPDKWRYTATADLPPGTLATVTATACDRPGNTASGTAIHAVG